MLPHTAGSQRMARGGEQQPRPPTGEGGARPEHRHRPGRSWHPRPLASLPFFRLHTAA